MNKISTSGGIAHRKISELSYTLTVFKFLGQRIHPSCPWYSTPTPNCSPDFISKEGC